MLHNQHTSGPDNSVAAAVVAGGAAGGGDGVVLDAGGVAAATREEEPVMATPLRTVPGPVVLGDGEEWPGCSAPNSHAH